LTDQTADGRRRRAEELQLPPSAIRHPPSAFRSATRDELWFHGRLVESRLSHGEAIHDERGITATDARDDALVERCEREIERMRQSIPKDARVRLIANASTGEDSATMTIGMRGLSIVTSPEHVMRDSELLRGIAAIEPEGGAIEVRGVPIVWRNGSAAVLLHEAIGHAMEHDHEPLEWPSWLDAGVSLRMRRATFRDVPLRRMTEVVARQSGAPFDVASPHIDVLLVAGGAYEPLSETVTLRVAAADYDGRRLLPFEIRATRAEVARAITGAEGEPIRYPGVVCSREGQELVVGSVAPVMLTVFR